MKVGSEVEKKTDRHRRGQTGGEVRFLSGGIKAGYAGVSSDRIMDGMPDPFPAHTHPPRDAHAHTQCSAA